jgi:hypothetical protein
MGKINKNDRTQHNIDQHFSDKLRNFEAKPPEFIWGNIEQNINADKEKSKFDHWYYVILALLIPITIANFLFNFNTENTSDELFVKTNSKIAAFFTKKEANISEINSNTSISASNNHSENSNISASTTSTEKTTNTSINYNINDVEDLVALNHNETVSFTDKGNFRKRDGSKKASIINNGAVAENKTLDSSESGNRITLLPETGVIDSRILSLEDNVALLKYENANNDNITNKTLKNLKGFFVGVDARIGNNWFLIKQAATNNFINNDVQYQFKYSSTFGISAGYNFSKNVGVEAEILYSRQGQSFVDNSFRKVPIEGNIELAYIRTPLMFKYKWANISALTQKPVVFNILFGPVYSRLISSAYTVSNEQFAKKAIIPVNELGLTLGFEYDVFMSNNSYLTLGVRTGVSSDVNSFPYAGPNTLKTLNLDLGLNASYNFQIRPKQKAFTTF